MKRPDWRSVRVISGFVFALVGVVAALGVMGASGEDKTLTSADARQLMQKVDRYWAAKQCSWPKEYRKSNRMMLPASLKSSIRAERSAIADELTTGRLKRWEDGFDAAGFLEELRQSGTVATASGYEILGMSEPVLVSANVAQAEVTVRSWSDQYEVDSEGNALGASYRTQNEPVYRYTFEKVGGVWKIASQDLLSNPLGDE